MIIKTKNDLENLRISGKILSLVLSELRDMAKIGTTLRALDERARSLISDNSGKPAFLGYQNKKDAPPYPSAICASVNERIVHCVPDEYKLKDGDVLKIDAGVIYKGYITDAAITVGIGLISPKSEKLIKATKSALEEAIKICKPGKTTGDIGWVIEKTVKNYGFSVVEKLPGHGVGRSIHEPPNIFNYGQRGEGVPLESGMVIAIEPMVSAGGGEIEEERDGGIKTKDGSLSSHFEKTVAITESGCEVLTPMI